MEMAQKFGILSEKWLELERTGALLCMVRRQLDTEGETLFCVCVCVCVYWVESVSITKPEDQK